MVIGFCGRLRSGKTELAKICEGNGYTKLYFALPLKELCAKILGMTIDELNEAKGSGKDISFKLDDKVCEILSNETEIPLEVVNDICDGKIISTVREMLQFIGTDLIRKHNNDWHVNKIKNMMTPDTDYVIDDVRFPNEKKMIEDMGGHCWFITRTNIDNVSNHTSETSITWKQCWNKLIINDKTLENLTFKWEIFMENYARSCAIRDKEFDRILENGLENNVTEFTMLDVLMLPREMFTYSPREYDKDSIKSITMNEDKSVTVKYNDDTYELVDNPLSIEDLKMFIN